MLEFHFRPYDTIHHHSLFLDTAWEQMEWIDVAGISCPVLPLHMELVFDLAHLAHHQFDLSLKHLIDMAGLLVFCRGQFHWDEMDVRLREFGLEGVFELASGFVANAFHLPWADEENAAQATFNASLRELLGLMDQPRLMDVRGVFRGFRAALQHQEGFRAKLAFIRANLRGLTRADSGLYRSSIKSINPLHETFSPIASLGGHIGSPILCSPNKPTCLSR